LAVTDQNVLNECQYALIETPNNGASWGSGLWTTSEVINYLNQRQFDFLKRTALLMARATLNTIPQEVRQALPSDWITTQRVAWLDAGTNLITEVPRGDGWEADHGIPTWPYDNAPGPPLLYTDGEVPNLQLEIMPPTQASGVLQILYVNLSATLSNSGVAFTVPDEWTPCIKWGVIADMLGKVGRGHDPQRASYAESRYQEGVEAAKLALQGWM
jgi:hypothetical protein